ncbi:MAG: lmo0937 family membrane protein [Chloroflexota bacterium]
MLWTVVGVLLLLWVIGAFVGNVGSVIHILLVVAAIVVVYNLVTRGRATL